MILSPLPQKAIRTEISQSTKKPNVMGTLGGKIVRDLPGVTPRLRAGGLSANDDVAAIQAWGVDTTWKFLCVWSLMILVRQDLETESHDGFAEISTFFTMRWPRIFREANGDIRSLFDSLNTEA
jgi:hypothetical protein